MSKKISEADYNDILEDPKAYGMPTFDEFCKNPDLLNGREDDRLQEVERGSINLKRVVKRYIYEIEGYQCRSLEEVERIARNMGINLREMDYRPHLETNASGKLDCRVKFISKAERVKRNKW